MAALKLLTMLEATTVTGPAKHLLEFWKAARELPEAPEITVATFQRGRFEENEFTEACRQVQLPCHCVVEQSAFDREALGQLRKLFSDQRPTVVQTNAVKSHFLARLAGAGNGRPWVAMHHGYTTTSRKMRAYNQLDRWSLTGPGWPGWGGKPPARVLTVSTAFERQLAALGVARSRIAVLHNPIYADWLKMTREEAGAWARERYGIRPEEPVILAVGRLSHEKAHVDLVAALQHVPQARLLIVGEGPERGNIEAAIASLSLADRVILAGHHSDVGPFFARADVFCLPSLSEGSPYVLLESMSAGVPVVASRVGGIPEMVTHEKTALLTPPQDPLALSVALQRILGEPVLGQRLAAEARVAIHERHSPEKYARDLLRFYGQAIEAR